MTKIITCLTIFWGYTFLIFVIGYKIGFSARMRKLERRKEEI